MRVTDGTGRNPGQSGACRRDGSEYSRRRRIAPARGALASGRPVARNGCHCAGPAEFVEKYFETVGDLLARKLTVVAFDWRGQGLSERELDNSRKGHIDDFSLYERDLDAILEQVLLPFCPKPWFALGHSMGGAILIRQARSGRSPFERLVLTAPMLELYGLSFPGFLRGLAKVLDLMGLAAPSFRTAARPRSRPSPLPTTS